ncbi:MAG: hypothetical protein HQL56_15960 [Magnetococcales bacterium]|nr:hypothetical protein [Magnetococcales bacterium]
MRHHRLLSVLLLGLVTGCSSAYVATPLPFRTPSGYANSQSHAGLTLGAKAFDSEDEAKATFGFDVMKAGLLPVQVSFDHQGSDSVAIVADQTFLEDTQGSLWPILDEVTAYERVTRYSQTLETFKEGSYGAMMGGVGGALLGGAIGIVTGKSVGKAVGQGAVIGAAIGGGVTGVHGFTDREAQARITSDLDKKALQNKPIEPGNLAFGYLFFPAEAKTAKTLRLQMKNKKTEERHTAILTLR